MDNFFKYKRKYKSRVGKSANIFDILPSKLTINRPLVPPNNNTLLRTKETIFKEIVQLPYRPDRNDAWIAQNLKRGKRGIIEPYEYIYNTLKQIIFNYWNPDKLKIITHSGGYDSRIISDIILNLTLEYGHKWLGDVLFVETRGESKEFLKIMKAQGWDKSNYIVITQQEYEHISFSFDRLKLRYNGNAAYPVNIWADPLLLLQERGIINGNFQHITGFGAYYERALRNMTYARFLSLNNYYQLASFNFYGETIMPFFCYDYILALKQCFSSIPKNMRTSQYICEKKLKYLDGIKRPTAAMMKRRRVNYLSRQSLSKVQHLYDSSLYGSKKPIKFNNHISYSKQWAMWNIANFVEELKESHDIRI